MSEQLTWSLNTKREEKAKVIIKEVGKKGDRDFAKVMRCSADRGGYFVTFPAEEEVEIVSRGVDESGLPTWLARRANGEFFNMFDFEDGGYTAHWTYYFQAAIGEEKNDEH